MDSAPATTAPHFATQLVHGPQTYKSVPHEPTVEAIYMNNTYEYPSAAETEEWFLDPRRKFVYSRYGNPTVRDFEERMTVLERGADAVAFSSGTSALLGALLTVAQTGDHLLVQRNCYGGSYYLAGRLAQQFGITATMVDATDLAACEAALTPNTKAMILETPANPTGAIVDLAATCAWAHAHNLKVVVDSTLASPALQQPLTLGTDIVWHSCTKYLGGHGDVMGGVAVCATQELAEDMWHRWMHALGTNLSPFNAFLLVRGMKTLALRMRQHSENAQAIAEWAEGDTRIDKVWYPGLTSHPGHEAASRQMHGGYGGLMAFDIRGGREAAFRVHDRVALFTRTASLGDCASLIVHPASTSHRQFTDAERAEWGVTQGTLRLSIGIEDVGDLIADLDQALG
ncbi:MAG: aminotransferase class I/II-fold pyridoxal phosphate-dependent enzyme [bacterium]